MDFRYERVYSDREIEMVRVKSQQYYESLDGMFKLRGMELANLIATIDSLKSQVALLEKEHKNT